MNLFNRIFTILSLLVLTVLVLGVLLVPPNLLSSSLTTFLGLVNTLQSALRALISLVFLAVVLFLLWLDLRRTSGRTVEVARSTGGRIHITTSHVEERIAEQVDAMSGVIQAKVKVNERDNGVVARIDVLTAPNLDLVTKGEDIAAKTREVVQDQLGLKMSGKPHIIIKASKPKPITTAPANPAPSDGNATGGNSTSTTGSKV